MVTTIRKTHGYYYLYVHGGYKPLTGVKATAMIEAARLLPSYKEVEGVAYIDHTWQAADDDPADIEIIAQQELERFLTGDV